MADRYAGKTALVSGASSGLGAAFARELARRRSNVILVARREERLKDLADELAERHSIRAEVIAADLTEAGAAAQVQSAVEDRGLSVDVLINNAGFSTFGRFEDIDFAREREMVLLNASAVAELCHTFVPAMLARRDGAVLNVASVVAMLPLPYQATYAATKAFVLSLSEAMWSQYRSRGVRVLALCPGALDTPFYDVMGSGGMNREHKEDPGEVAADGLDHLAKGSQPLRITNPVNFWTVSGLRRGMPRAVVARLIEKKFPYEAPASSGSK